MAACLGLGIRSGVTRGTAAQVKGCTIREESASRQPYARGDETSSITGYVIYPRFSACACTAQMLCQNADFVPTALFVQGIRCP